MPRLTGFGGARMWIVKIGGSLAFAPELRDWLAVLESGAGTPVVVVPGGATFADEVRLAQTLRGFDDRIAHRMAVLATEQYGLMLCGLAAHLVPAATPEEIAGAQAAGQVPVWMADAMTRGADDIPETWDVSADSLAAWLARKLGADTLVLVKASAPPRTAARAGDLAAAGYVDAAFPGMARGLALFCFSAGEAKAFAECRAAGTLDGAAIETA